jgi:ribosomal protein L37AE/L43A
MPVAALLIGRAARRRRRAVTDQMDEMEQAMNDRARCPMCADGEVTRSEGRLEQSGNTYLPTSMWTCDTCGYVRYEPAVVVHWRPIEPSRAPARAMERERLVA